MRLEDIADWGLKSITSSDRQRELLGGREFVGIAIGPNSEESLVEIDGFGILQAGRVLAVRSKVYRIKRVRPLDALGGGTGFAANVLPINRLQLQLFETEAELAAGATARANRDYQSAVLINAGASNRAAIVVPFCGHRQAQFVINSVLSPATPFTLWGLKYSYASALVNGSAAPVVPVVTAYALKTGNLTWSAAFPGGNFPIAPPANYCTAAFYLGGTDNAEDWDALCLDLTNGSGNARTYIIDARVIGDIGKE